MSDTCLRSLKMRRYKNRSRSNSQNAWCIEWLKLNHLEHIMENVLRSGIDIEKLSESDTLTIRETASYKMRLHSEDLSLFVAAVIRYHNLEALHKRNEEVTSCLNSLEFTQKEVDIKRTNDIQYIEHKFNRLVRALDKRKTFLVSEIKNKSAAKLLELDEQMDSLREYQSRLRCQHEVLLQTRSVLNTDCDDFERLNFESKVLLNESISYDRHRISRINKMSVDVPEYDDMMAQIRSLGIIDDEFDLYSHSDCEPRLQREYSQSGSSNSATYCHHRHVNHIVHESDKNSVHMDSVENVHDLECPCGSPLILTNVEFAYSAGQKVYCQFCKHRCDDDVQCRDIYHCAKGDIDAHPGGFDLCSLCGTRSINSKKVKQRRATETRQWMKDREATQFMMSSVDRSRTHSVHQSVSKHSRRVHSRKATMIAHVMTTSGSMKDYDLMRRGRHHLRSQTTKGLSLQFNADDLMSTGTIDSVPHFPYPKQLKRVVEMGYDVNKAKDLVLKHRGNMAEIMGELMT